MNQVAKVLIDGGLAVIPTDTLYGLVCSALDKSAVKKLYELKSRDKKPGTIIASSIDQLASLGVKRRYLKSVEHYWPGKISVVVPSEISLSYIDQAVGTLAVRVVDDPKLITLLNSTGPLLTSSANHPGEPPATTINKAKDYFGGQVDEYIDGGDLSDRKPSTVIRVVDDAVEILREGAVTINQKGEVAK